ncbi:hypothetical protein G7067_00265 [Leucobacter insecticola]|uniref:SMI1/KNR4 family protein n=1 Tax=Leucobacter insecticola TaxID=2714934 RepID=A0A6G8FFS6_9MICO|nr:hypothetical protein [Leucobacter insecticola]QIM15198.1 hypothetical protein G7067_00265 [Leucobacter insecticola]
MGIYIERYERIGTLWGVPEDMGIDIAHLESWREKFGDIPEALLVYYSTFGTHRELNETQDALILPDSIPFGYHKMKDVPDTDHLVFYVENQWALGWGIAPDQTSEVDPIVEISEDAQAWSSTGETVSEFLLAQAYMQRVMSFEYTTEEFWDISEDFLSQLESKVPLALTSNLYEGVSFFGDETQLALVSGSIDKRLVWFGSDDEENFNDLREWSKQHGR